MAQVTIYLPDSLSERLRRADFNISRVCREALEAELRLREAQRRTVSYDATPPSEQRRATAVEQTTERPVVDCTNPGRPTHPEGWTTRHIGPIRRLSWGQLCDACGQKVQPT